MRQRAGATTEARRTPAGGDRPGPGIPSPAVGIPFPERTLHLVYSFACNLTCAHCLYRCGPGDRGVMGLERAKDVIDQAAEAGVRRIAFLGGEPFLHPEALRTLIRHAGRNGLVTAAVTNGSWASTPARAAERLGDMAAAGLGAVTLSTDRFHLPGVPLRRIENAVAAAVELGLRVGVKISRFPHDLLAVAILRSLRPLCERIAVQEVSPLGRGEGLRGSVTLRGLEALPASRCSTPPVVLPDGNLVTCCNLPARDLGPDDPPFLLGNLHRTPLRTLLRRRREAPLLAFLRRHGPLPLLGVPAHGGPSPKEGAEGLYHDECDLCFHLLVARRRKPIATPVSRVAAPDRPGGAPRPAGPSPGLRLSRSGPACLEEVPRG